MRVLLTNNALDLRAGSELYVRDIAIELLRRGHQPVAYSTRLGTVAEELRGATVPVIDRLNSLGEPPDIIHGQHHYETFTALQRFPSTPAVYFCHGWMPWQEAPLQHPNIVRYVAVDHLCRERLITEGGVSPDIIDVVFNFFDQRLFPARSPLPATPKRALLFGNEFSNDATLKVFIEACERSGMELDVRGVTIGFPSNRPGDLLAEYDVVFAKARSAIEAMAVGASVVLCGYGRLGPMVTAGNFEELRPWNFGIRILSMNLSVDALMAELQRYNAADASVVSHEVRRRCELQPAADRLIEIYGQAREQWRPSAPITNSSGKHAANYLEHWASQYKASFKALAERDSWAQRCSVAEQGLILQDQRLSEKEIELAKLADQADRNAADLQSKSQEVIEGRKRWERAEEELKMRQQLIIKLSEQAGQARVLASEQKTAMARLVHELNAIRASATWRWSQRLLQSSVVQVVFGSLLQQVAQTSSTRTDAVPEPVQPKQETDPYVAIQSRANRMIEERGFLGVPKETFAEAGSQQLIALLSEGLLPDSKVLEFGCGCLRVAYWLVRFLEPGGYAGIEPARDRVTFGQTYLFLGGELEHKQPRFDFNEVFDSSVFGTKFDFFLARSIWTHASKSQIAVTLDSFVRDSKQDAIFLASYLPATSAEDDYQGEEWVGTSHRSDVPGVIRHSLSWIREQCRSRGLVCEEIPGTDCDFQFWLRVRRSLDASDISDLT